MSKAAYYIKVRSKDVFLTVSNNWTDVFDISNVKFFKSLPAAERSILTDPLVFDNCPGMPVVARKDFPDLTGKEIKKYILKTK